MGGDVTDKWISERWNPETVIVTGCDRCGRQMTRRCAALVRMFGHHRTEAQICTWLAREKCGGPDCRFVMYAPLDGQPELEGRIGHGTRGAAMDVPVVYRWRLHQLLHLECRICRKLRHCFRVSKIVEELGSGVTERYALRAWHIQNGCNDGRSLDDCKAHMFARDYGPWLPWGRILRD